MPNISKGEIIGGPVRLGLEVTIWLAENALKAVNTVLADQSQNDQHYLPPSQSEHPPKVTPLHAYRAANHKHID